MFVLLLKAVCPVCRYWALFAELPVILKRKAWALVEVIYLQTVKVSAALAEETWGCYPWENDEIFGA